MWVYKHTTRAANDQFKMINSDNVLKLLDSTELTLNVCTYFLIINLHLWLHGHANHRD